MHVFSSKTSSVLTLSIKSTPNLIKHSFVHSNRFWGCFGRFWRVESTFLSRWLPGNTPAARACVFGRRSLYYFNSKLWLHGKFSCKLSSLLPRSNLNSFENYFGKNCTTQWMWWLEMCHECMTVIFSVISLLSYTLLHYSWDHYFGS